MRAKPLIAVVGVLVVLVAGVAGVYAYGSSGGDRIAPGVRAGGVDLSGLTATAARLRLRDGLLRPLERPLVVRHGSERFRLSAQRARVTADVDGTVDEALQRSQQGSVFARAWDKVRGTRQNVDLEPKVSYSQRAVSKLVRQVDGSVSRPPQDASVSLSGGGLRKVPGRSGMRVDTDALRSDVESRLTSAGSRRVAVVTRRTPPKVTRAELAKKYPQVIAIDRANFKLRFYRHLKLSKTYTIAVGKQGLETPAGQYDIQAKEVNPSWHVPNSSWAGDLAGKTIPPGPDDPIKARWMAIDGGAGIHGTEESDSLGSAASHGCIRMAIPDVIQLYSMVPVKTPVFIA